MAPSSSFIDSTASISTLIDDIIDLGTNPPSLYFDLEGIRLSREGSISILQLLAHPKDHVYLIDVHFLKSTAFTTAGSSGKTLKDILESPTIPKLCFDVRNDSDALFHHFRIALEGIQDVQLMENASRGPGGSKRLLNGLAKCIENDAPITMQEKQSWKAVKERGASVFAPEKGGSYEVFNDRPLNQDILGYCVQDVQFLPHLWRTYSARLSAFWRNKMEDETKNRVLESRSETYEPHGSNRTLGPWYP